jgi:hypothetical protein
MTISNTNYRCVYDNSKDYLTNMIWVWNVKYLYNCGLDTILYRLHCIIYLKVFLFLTCKYRYSQYYKYELEVFQGEKCFLVFSRMFNRINLFLNIFYVRTSSHSNIYVRSEFHSLSELIDLFRKKRFLSYTLLTSTQI